MGVGKRLIGDQWDRVDGGIKEVMVFEQVVRVEWVVGAGYMFWPGLVWY